ncbi:Malto-oligosyltrehalose trehalohydrolase OS=Streptomyces albaduncus OX=68172 GN=FHS32_001365 PE=3 SV=1 [Streptomyces griseoloalbus]
MNLGTDPADIPLGSREARVLAAWEPVDIPGADGSLRLPAESAVVLLQE